MRPNDLGCPEMSAIMDGWLVKAKNEPVVVKTESDQYEIDEVVFMATKKLSDDALKRKLKRQMVYYFG